jgi:hypothetical protein
MRHRDLRTALAVEVVAAAMPDTTLPNLYWTNDECAVEWAELTNAATRRGAILNTALHALLTHDRYDRTHTLTESPDTTTFDKIVERAITIGTSCKGSWDGWEYAWESHADKLTRYIESVCTFFVPDASDQAIDALRTALSS